MFSCKLLLPYLKQVSPFFHVSTATSSINQLPHPFLSFHHISSLCETPPSASMAEHRQGYQYQQQQQPTDAIKGMLPEKTPSKSQVLAVVTLLPVGGTLLLLSGLTLAGTLTCLALATPLFIICSPVLVPAALVIGLAIAGFLTSGAFGVTALSSFSWLASFLRRMRVPEQMEQAKRRIQDTTGQIGQKVKETGQTIPQKAQETGRDLKDKEGGKT